MHLDLVVDNLADAVTTAQTAGARLPDFFSPLHGPAKTVTLGVGLALLASMLYFSASDSSISVHELLISIFLLLTTPVSTHLMARAGLHLGMRTAASRSTSDSSHEEH